MGAPPTVRQSFDPDVLDNILIDQHGPDASSRQQQDAYDLLMDKLTASQRQVLEARLSGLSYSKCAAQLGIAIRTVRSQEAKALDKLRRLASDSPDLFNQ